MGRRRPAYRADRCADRVAHRVQQFAAVAVRDHDRAQEALEARVLEEGEEGAGSGAQGVRALAGIGAERVHVLGEQAADIEVRDADADVAVASNVASLGVGMGTTWGATAMVAAAGGPVGWAVAAGVVVGVGVGYGAYYVLSGTETGRKAVRAVTDTAKSVGEGIGAAARKVGGWLGI
ncbi:hypothetical protein G3I34_12400 [Streptomyces sp. SID8014]|uniref:hypothetical protein n=1 Tax=Streptomyces sp. SID8014 TaxID=2706097 RepID=UPI0013B89DE3|nr:hypothetical protein [Streptomyces sp. SID8014]NEC13068.1 hypothetical protein [Streptomyces sp. SID8014]